MTENLNLVDTSEEDEIAMLMEQGCDVAAMDGWIGGEELLENGVWDEEDMWFLQQHWWLIMFKKKKGTKRGRKKFRLEPPIWICLRDGKYY